MADGKYYDETETMDPQTREAVLFDRLPAQIDHAKQNSSAGETLFGDVSSSSITDRASLTQLPITRKSSLLHTSGESALFLGFSTRKPGQYRKIYASPGPIYEPESEQTDYWRLARALFAAGFRPGEVIHNSYSYHLTPAGSMLESGAFELGCAVVPGGVGQTELQLNVIKDVQPDGYVGTPSFLRILLEKADELSMDISCLKKASVSGEALPESLRASFGEAGINVLQTYATADVGLIAYETIAGEGMVLAEDIIVEIVRPGSGEPVADGEVGEVVVTTLNPDYPLIRFATGDLSAIMDSPSPCGRTNKRIRGWMGRADQTTKVRGMFVRPELVNKVAERFSEIHKFRLTVSNPDGADDLLFQYECSPDAEVPAEKLAEVFRDICKVRTRVEAVSGGSLPNDGKVIADARNYD